MIKRWRRSVRFRRRAPIIRVQDRVRKAPRPKGVRMRRAPVPIDPEKLRRFLTSYPFVHIDHYGKKYPSAEKEKLRRLRIKFKRCGELNNKDLATLRKLAYDPRCSVVGYDSSSVWMKPWSFLHGIGC